MLLFRWRILAKQEYYNKTYGTYKLEYRLPENELYYNGKRVKYFADNQSAAASGFAGCLWDYPCGGISVKLSVAALVKSLV